MATRRRSYATVAVPPRISAAAARGRDDVRGKPICNSACRSGPSGDMLHVQDQTLALAPGAADHDLLVGRPFLLAEHRVAVLGNTGDHARHAFAADAEFARVVDVDAGLIKHFKDLLALRDVILLAGAREFHPETA